MTKDELERKVQQYYVKYVKVQTQIDAMEANAFEAAQRDKRAQKWLLEDSRTDGGFAYKNLCSDRERYMKLIQLYGMMALLAP